LLRPSDADELFGLIDANRAYLRTWLPWLDGTISAANTEDFIRSTLQQFADNRGFVAAICHEQSIVGVIGYNQIDWQNRIGYIGYWLAQDCQGKGLMTTSCKAVLDYGFGVLNLNRLVITCAAENKRSRAIPERLGFVHEGTTRDAEWLYDHFVDHEVYVQFHRDWNHKNTAYRLELMPPADFEFLYNLCRSTMESYVVVAWGKWHDEVVRSQLLDGLKADAFSSIFMDQLRIGAIAVERHVTHIQIEDLYILPEFQNQGIGTAIVLDLLEEARQGNKPVRLRVLSSSPARALYERLGFVIVQTTPERYFMEYSDLLNPG
jgi:ribosomal-protein-serine acetyltransferase